MPMVTFNTWAKKEGPTVITHGLNNQIKHELEVRGYVPSQYDIRIHPFKPIDDSHVEVTVELIEK